MMRRELRRGRKEPPPQPEEGVRGVHQEEDREEEEVDEVDPEVVEEDEGFRRGS